VGRGCGLGFTAGLRNSRKANLPDVFLGFRVLSHRQREFLGTGASGMLYTAAVQADQLHVDLWHHGVNIARDAGNLSLQWRPPMEQRISGDWRHNTVIVDGKDQMRRAGRFLWLDWAQASGRAFHGNLSNASRRPVG